MSSSEWTHWIAYSKVEPFGGQVEDYRAGLTPAVIQSALRSMGGDKDSPVVRPLDYFHWYKVAPPPPKRETPAELAARIKREIFHVVDAKRG